MRRLLISVTALTLLGGGVANAHMIWGAFTTVTGSDSTYEACATAWLDVGDGYHAEYPGGQMQIFTDALQSSSPGNGCDSWWTRPKGYLANHAILWKDDGESVDVCKDGGLAHSVKAESEFKMQWTFKYAPCGSGNYFEAGQAAVKDNSGNWIPTEWTESTDEHWLR
ncbi:MAG: hypothetical protein ACYDCC_03770 [Actinomycetota bacterium]